jgi:hypothetical protein
MGHPRITFMPAFGGQECLPHTVDSHHEPSVGSGESCQAPPGPILFQNNFVAEEGRWFPSPPYGFRSCFRL